MKRTIVFLLIIMLCVSGMKMLSVPVNTNKKIFAETTENQDFNMSQDKANESFESISNSDLNTTDDNIINNFNNKTNDNINEFTDKTINEQNDNFQDKSHTQNTDLITKNQNDIAETSDKESGKPTKNNITESDEICISVIGVASKSLTPDSAVIFASLETNDSDMIKSKDDTFEKFKTLSTSLSDAGIDEKSINLDFFSSYPRFERKTRTSDGYSTTLNFSVRVKNIDNVRNVIDTLSANGVNSINDIRYELSNLDEEYGNVLSSALENAKMKASKLLNKSDLKIVAIREESVYMSSVNSLSTISAETSGSLSGKIELKARINVEFA